MSGATSLREDRSVEGEPDRAQASYSLPELQHQLALIDEELTTLRERLARCQRQHWTHQVKHLQQEVRQAAIQRRQILDMVTALSQRFRV
ncbi:MAG TPA: hypothetical protein PLI79_08015 [Mycobacterium sp.]|nr:hypothetical protein [Mycobacterium sp.]